MNRLSKLIAALLVGGVLGWGGFASAQSSSSIGPLNKSISTQGIWAGGGIQSKGSISQNAIGTPSAPTAVTNGTAGTTSVNYYCVAMDSTSNPNVQTWGLVTNQGDSIPS